MRKHSPNCISARIIMRAKKNFGKYFLASLAGLLFIPPIIHAQGYDKAPQFPGGNAGLEKYLTQKMKYPEAARKQEIEGKVMVGFSIDTKGKVININVLKHVHALLDSEAVRVVRAMPVWQPATKGKNKIIAPVMLPITFKLRDPQNKR